MPEQLGNSTASKSISHKDRVVVVAEWLEGRSNNLEVPILNPPGARAFSFLLSMAECP